MDLIDFQLLSHGIYFMYVLPYKKSRAFIENTWICAHTKHNDYAQELHFNLSKRWPNAQFKIDYTEARSLLIRNVTSSENYRY